MSAGVKRSVNVTNIEANPITVINRRLVGAVSAVVDAAELATTNIDDIGDVVLLCPVPSDAVITDIEVLNDDLDSGTALAADVGLYYSGIGHTDKAKVSGTVLDVDCFASAVTTLQSAHAVWTSVRYEAANIDTVVQEAWEVGGLAADPKGLLYVGITVTTAAGTAVAGGVKMRVTYML